MDDGGLEPADWLRICDGFTVEFEDGRRGRVAELRYRSHPTRPDVLLVRVGLFVRRLVPVGIDEIHAILPRERRLVVRTPRQPSPPLRRDDDGGIVRFPARHRSRIEFPSDDAAYG